MAIIRRNPDGTIASQEDLIQATSESTNTITPSISNIDEVWQAMAEAGRAIPPLMSEIATKINNAKDKPRKLKVLKDNDSVCIKTSFKRCISIPKIKWLLPKGDDIPYEAKNDAPVGTEHTQL